MTMTTSTLPANTLFEHVSLGVSTKLLYLTGFRRLSHREHIQAVQ